ncbi:hypothetical protein Bca101_008551 [Brassica carinata]
MSETQQVQNSTGSIPSSDKTEGYFGDCLRFRSVEPRPTPNSKAEFCNGLVAAVKRMNK